MAISVTGLTTHTQNGGGTWQDWGGGGGSSSTTATFLSGTSAQGRKFTGFKGFGYQVNATGTDLSTSIILVRFLVNGGLGATLAGGGMSIRLEDTTGNTSDWYVAGSDTYNGGWFEAVIDTSNAESANSGTAATLTAIQYVGIYCNAAASSGGDPNVYVDEILSMSFTGLTLAGNTTNLFDEAATWDETSLYGIITRRGGVIYSKCPLTLSPDASDHASTDEIIVFEEPIYEDGTNVDSALTRQGIRSTDTDTITLTRLTAICEDNGDITGTNADKRLDLANATDIVATDCTFRGFDGNTAALGASTNDYTRCTFQACALITDTGAVIRDCIFRNAADAAGAYKWTENSDIQDCQFFSDGTGYGIQYRPTGAGPFTEAVTNIEFDNYGLDETANAAIHIYPVTTTVTITFNITGTEPTYDEDATYTGTFTSVVNPVTTLITVRDIDTGLPIQNARVKLIVSDGTNFPYNASVTITSSGTTATVTHTSHGLTTGDWVKIEGVTNGEAYNGSKQITVTGANTYTYTIASGQTSPATGTILSTFMYFNDLTDVNGQVTDTRSISSNQDVEGWVRKSSTSPLYKQQPIDETISNTAGLTLNVQLISDE